jgi:hypothetical protein
LSCSHWKALPTVPLLFSECNLALTDMTLLITNSTSVPLLEGFPICILPFKLYFAILRSVGFPSCSLPCPLGWLPNCTVLFRNCTSSCASWKAFPTCILHSPIGLCRALRGRLSQWYFATHHLCFAVNRLEGSRTCVVFWFVNPSGLESLIPAIQEKLV